jgi:hypothetical protein
MNVIIRETGEARQLTVASVLDLLGNAGALTDGQFTWSEEADAWFCDADTYEWWAAYIAGVEQTDADIAELAADLELSPGDVRAYVQVNTDLDYEQHRNQSIAALDAIRQAGRIPAHYYR